MKTRFSPLAAALGFFAFTLPTPGAESVTAANFARTYVDIAFQTYSDAAAAAAQLKEAAATLKREPNALSLAYIRLAWVEARAPFLQAEVFGFADGPIDSGEKPAVSAINGAVNPDFIDGAKASILVDTASYPVIDATLLASLNGKGGAGNVATGFHALEFLLWGPRGNANGAGRRPFTDFLADSPMGARRADYVVACAEILSSQLDALAAEWNPETTAGYRASFLKLPADTVQGRVLDSVATLAGVELAGKRLGKPLESGDGAVAESPFSNLTQLDVLHPAAGIANIMAGAYLGTDRDSGMRVQGTGLIAVVEARDAKQGAALREAVNKVILAARALQGPFDLAVAAGEGDPNRKTFVDCATALESLAAEAKSARDAILGANADGTPE